MSATVREVMTRPVITAQPTTPFQTLAQLLTTHQIAAVPVMEDGRLVGIVSETDLLLKEEQPHAASAPLVAVVESRRRRAERAKATGRTAGAIMTTPPVTVTADTPVGAAARLMHKHGIHHLPVVDAQGGLLGIVSRSDLLRVYVRSDQAIRKQVTEAVAERPWLDPEQIAVTVDHGVVTLRGRIQRASLIAPLAHAVEEVDGVVGVNDQLTADVDDVSLHNTYYPLLRS